MEELLRLMRSVREGLAVLVQLNNELISLMNEEEGFIAAYDMTQIERIVIRKDQIVQSSKRMEARRQNQLTRICFLISFDARGGSPGLSTFCTVFENYLSQVKSLLHEVVFEELRMEFSAFREQTAEVREQYEMLQPRIYRNKLVLQKAALNFSRSLAIFSQDSDVSLRYGKTGKVSGAMVDAGAVSSLRVRA